MADAIVSEAQVDESLEYLFVSAEELGKAEAEVRRAKAMAMKGSPEKSIAGQERDADTDQGYLKAKAYLETLKALRDAHAMRIEIWRTQSSNWRAMKL